MDRRAYETMAETEDRHWWFVGRRRIIERELEALSLPRDASIIDLGAGTGGNLAMLGRFGHVAAMEPDDGARVIASARNNLDIRAGTLPNAIPFPDGSADVVGLFDVLEHVEDDRGSLLAIRRLLKPDGFLLLTVPAHQWLWSAHDEMLHHFRRYSRRGLRSLAVSSGFRVRKLSFFNAALFPLAAAMRLSNMRQADRSPAGVGIPPRFLNAAMTGILRAEGGLLRLTNLPVGLSLLATLQKPQAE